MAFDHNYRPYSYASLGVFIITTFLGYFFLKRSNVPSVLTSRMILVGGIVTFLSIIQLFVAIRINPSISLFDVFRVLYAVPVLWSVFLAVRIWGEEWYSEAISIVILLLCFLAIILYLSGFYLDSMNFYASMLLLPTMYALLSGKYKMFFILALLLFFLGLMFEARGAYMAMIAFLVVYIFNRLIKVNAILMLFVVLAVIFLQLFLLLDNSVLADEILTYRPSIWRYYYMESMDGFWFGNGPILTETSEDAAKYYQYMAGRGVGLSYGTQSMYMLYFYESGVVGLSLLVVIFTAVFLSKSKFVTPVLTISVLAMLETVKVGAVSVYGLPLTYFIALSMASERKVT